MKRLRVLFYGLTHEHAPGKLETLKRMRDAFEIVAIADDRAVTPCYFQTDSPILPEGVPVVDEKTALEMKDIDVVFVETVNGRLMEIARLFADRGVPMHCDKPCGEAMEPYRSIVETCRKKNLPFQIGYMYRGNPALKFAWNAVRSGWLGEVSFIEADMNHDYGYPGYAPFISGFKGGILYNLGCHLVDMALPMVRGEFLSALPFVGDAPGDPEGSRTAAVSFLRFAGTDVLIRTSSNMPGSILCRRLRVDGTNGTLEIRPIERFDGGRLTLEMTLKNPAGEYGSGRQELDFGVQTDRYADQLSDLAAIVRGDKPNDQDYDRDLKVHELTLKACGI